MATHQEFMDSAKELNGYLEKEGRIVEELEALVKEFKQNINSKRPEKELPVIQKLIELLLEYTEILEKIRNHKLPTVTWDDDV